jgi:hypothetical protein
MDGFMRLGQRTIGGLLLACLAVSGMVRASEIQLTSGSFMADEAPAETTVAQPQIADTGTLCPDCADCDGCCQDRLFGLFLSPRDTSDFAGFISPMTNPVYFEDPRTLTEARVIFIQHRIPNRAPLAGGDVQLIAVQLRAALTENLSVIATKDGYIISGSDAPGDDGWANVNLGLKYNLYKDVETQRILSGAVVFELPVGSTRALQGNGSGVFDVKLTGATQLSERWRAMSALGLRLPTDSVDNSQSSYWSVHFDRTLGNRGWYFFTEYNWYHWLKSGKTGLPGVEGLDLYNLGSTGVAGNDIVTGAIGLKYKPTAWREYGVAWEVPLTDRRDIIDNRITADVIFRY